MADPTRSYLEKVYFRGEFVDYKDALVPISTSALQYGVGCFGGIRGYLQKDGSIGIFRLDNHAKRQAKAIKLLGLKIDLGADEIKDKILQLVKLNQPTTNFYIRPLVYKSDTLLGPALKGDYDFAIYMLSLGEYLDTDSGLSVNISKIPRVADEAIPSKAKATGLYINAAIAIDDANQQGFDSTIMLGSEGNVAEGAVMNIFLVKNGVLVTPELNGDLLEGITRKSIIELAKLNDLKVEERIVSKAELFEAEEVFFTGTATQIAYIKSVDGRQISSSIGKITKLMQDEFNKVVTGEHELSSSWMEVI